MWPVSSTWLAALGQPHGMYSRAEAWYNGAFVAPVPLAGGQVEVTAQNRQRRTLTALVSELLWPEEAGDALDVAGGQLKVWVGITDARGRLIENEVPVFTGRVEDLDRERFAGHITVTGLDPAADINDAQFEQPRVPSAGSGVIPNIVGLIVEVRPDAVVVDQTGSTATLPASAMWSQNRGPAMDDLTASVGGEVFCLPDGTRWVIRPVPTIDDPPVWTVKEGQGGVLVRDVMGRSRTDVPNRIVVHAEQAGQSPITTVVTDDNPLSPTRYGGPYGKVVRNYFNALITSLGQAQVAGEARLARSQGLTRTRALDIIPNPALEAGDIIQVVTAEGTEVHVADAFPVPLAPTDLMTVTTRSTLMQT